MNKEDNLDECEIQKLYVRNNEQTLRGIYGFDYIAVKDRTVIDHDKNEFALAKRMEEQFRSHFVLISTIEDIVNPVEHNLQSL